jgi:phosphate starvation-inducible PhoH-like protein
MIPRSLAQEHYVDILTDVNCPIAVTSGPAGTGKTYLAMLAAIRALKLGYCDKLVLTRPAVGVDDEKHGFLPGDLNAKMEPWTRPLFDVLKEYYSIKEITRMLDEEILEISPLAFMRGRTFKKSWIIADEMQNATPSQIMMLLTRLGEGSKIVVTGDVKQADRNNSNNGLLNFNTITDSREMKYIRTCRFTKNDIERHPAVAEVLSLYGEE